ILDVNEVKLKILARSDVRDVVRVLFGKLRQSLELSGVQSAEGNLDALHSRRVPECVGTLGSIGRIFQLLLGAAVMALAVIVTLAVGAAAETGLGEDAIFDLSLLL